MNNKIISKTLMLATTLSSSSVLLYIYKNDIMVSLIEHEISLVTSSIIDRKLNPLYDGNLVVSPELKIYYHPIGNDDGLATHLATSALNRDHESNIHPKYQISTTIVFDNLNDNYIGNASLKSTSLLPTLLKWELLKENSTYFCICKIYDYILTNWITNYHNTSYLRDVYIMNESFKRYSKKVNHEDGSNQNLVNGLEFPKLPLIIIKNNMSVGNDIILKNNHIHNIFLNFNFIKTLISTSTSIVYNPIESMNLNSNMNNLLINKQMNEIGDDNLKITNTENIISKSNSSTTLLANVILCTPSLSYTTDIITLTDNYLDTNQDVDRLDSNKINKNMNMDMIELSNWLKNINVEYIVSSPPTAKQAHLNLNKAIQIEDSNENLISEDIIQYVLDITNNNLNISKRIINRFILDYHNKKLTYHNTSKQDKEEELKEEDRNRNNEVECTDDIEFRKNSNIIQMNKDHLKAIYMDVIDKFAISYFKNIFHIEPVNSLNNTNQNNYNTNDNNNVIYYLDPTTHKWMEAVRKFNFSENQQVCLYQFIKYLLEKNNTSNSHRDNNIHNIKNDNDDKKNGITSYNIPYTCTVNELLSFFTDMNYSGYDLEELFRQGVLCAYPDNANILIDSNTYNTSISKETNSDNEDNIDLNNPIQQPNATSNDSNDSNVSYEMLFQIQRIRDINPFINCHISVSPELILAFEHILHNNVNNTSYDNKQEINESSENILYITKLMDARSELFQINQISVFTESMYSDIKTELHSIQEKRRNIIENVRHAKLQQTYQSQNIHNNKIAGEVDVQTIISSVLDLVAQEKAVLGKVIELKRSVLCYYERFDKFHKEIDDLNNDFEINFQIDTSNNFILINNINNNNNGNISNNILNEMDSILESNLSQPIININDINDLKNKNFYLSINRNISKFFESTQIENIDLYNYIYSLLYSSKSLFDQVDRTTLFYSMNGILATAIIVSILIKQGNDF